MEVVPDAQKTEEPEGQEFGSYCFEELKPVEVLETVAVEEITLKTGDGDEDSTPPLRNMAKDTPVKESPPLGSEGDEHSTPSNRRSQRTSTSHGIQALKAEGDEHSTPSSVTSSTGTEELEPDAEGDKYSTPSSTKDSNDIMTGLAVDVMDVVWANSSESDEHLTSSTEQRGERECRLTDNGTITKQTVTKEQGIVNSQINTSKLGWFGTQVTHFVETITYTGSKVWSRG